MSRLNGPAFDQSGHPHARQAAPEPLTQTRQPQNGAAASAPLHWPSPGNSGYDAGQYAPPQQAYAPVQGQGYAPAPPAYSQPQGYAAQPGLPPQRQAASAPANYAPQFDRYVPQQPAAQQAGMLNPQDFSARQRPDSMGYASLSAAPSGHTQQSAAAQIPPARDPLAELRASTHDHYRATPDPRGYDLGNYMPAQTAPPQRGYQQPEPQSLEQWSGHDPYAEPMQDPRMAQRGVDDRGAPRTDLQQYADEGVEHDDSEYEEVEEPPRRRRGLYVVAALVGAIGLGGALAYGYKSFLAPPKSNGTPPVVRKEAAPAKQKPADPGGRQFANQDSKVLGRLGEQTPAGATAASLAAGDVDASGVRKVPTLAVGRDGSIAAAPPAQAPAVPGMILDNSFNKPPAAPAVQAPPTAAAPPVAPRVAAAPVQPQVQAPASPPVAKAPPVAVANVQAAEPPVAAQPPQAKAVPKKQKPRDDLAAAGGQPVATSAAAAPATAAPKGGITGYMAVVGSPKTRMDALKTFADLQQKYPDVLGGKAPEVQESDQSARGLGTIYRVMVGPPGSREAATTVCTQLKAAGHGGCWVTSF